MKDRATQIAHQSTSKKALDGLPKLYSWYTPEVAACDDLERFAYIRSNRELLTQEFINRTSVT